MDDESNPQIRMEQDGPVACLYIDHARKHNALTFDMWESIPGLLRRLDEDPGCRLAVIRGAGRDAFAAGSDISQFGALRSTPEGIARYNATVAGAIDSLRAFRKPLVARIHGYCIGAGMALAMHCDLRYATEDAFFAVPAGKLGLAYQHLWLQRLASLVGPAHAKEIMLTADRYSARQAVDMGLVNRVCNDDAFKDIAASICAMAPLTQQASKIAIDQSASPDPYDHEACEAALKRCFASRDYVEGQAAFREKRKPEFTGC